MLCLLFCVGISSCLIEKGYVCPDCISGALKIRIEDSDTKMPIANARIVVIKNQIDTMAYCDTCSQSSWFWSDFDSTYQFPGMPGYYQMSFSHNDYDSFTISNIHVTQWSEVTCEYSNTKNLIISVNKRSINKSAKQSSFSITSQFEDGHCM